MDVVELSNVGDIYRLVPGRGSPLTPIKISPEEKTKKLCRVTSKVSIRGARTQIGFHDGRTVIADTDARPGDTCLIQIPEQRILETMRLEEGAQIIVTKGTNVGQAGTIEKIEKGTFSLPKRAQIALGDRRIEIQADNTMVVGRDGPAIQVQ